MGILDEMTALDQRRAATLPGIAEEMAALDGQRGVADAAREFVTFRRGAGVAETIAAPRPIRQLLWRATAGGKAKATFLRAVQDETIKQDAYKAEWGGAAETKWTARLGYATERMARDAGQFVEMLSGGAEASALYSEAIEAMQSVRPQRGETWLTESMLGALDNVPRLAASAMAGPVVGAKTAASVTAATTSMWVSQLAPGRYRQYTSEGLPHERALPASIISAVPEAIIETALGSLGGGRTLATLGKGTKGPLLQAVRKVVFNTLKEYGKELLEEPGQEGVSETVKRAFAIGLKKELKGKGVPQRLIDATTESAGPLMFLMLGSGAITTAGKAVSRAEAVASGPAGITEEMAALDAQREAGAAADAAAGIPSRVRAEVEGKEAPEGLAPAEAEKPTDLLADLKAKVDAATATADEAAGPLFEKKPAKATGAPEAATPSVDRAPTEAAEGAPTAEAKLRKRVKAGAERRAAEAKTISEIMARAAELKAETDRIEAALAGGDLTEQQRAELRKGAAAVEPQLAAMAEAAKTLGVEGAPAAKPAPRGKTAATLRAELAARAKRLYEARAKPAAVKPKAKAKAKAVAAKPAPAEKLRERVEASGKPPKGATPVSGGLYEVEAEALTTRKEFQARRRISEKNLEHIRDNWDVVKDQPLQVWEDPKTGELVVLQGHHRLKVHQEKGTKPKVMIQRGNKKLAVFMAEQSNVQGKPYTAVEVMDLIVKRKADGQSTAEIAKRLNLSQKAVGDHYALRHLSPGLQDEVQRGALDLGRAVVLARAAEKHGWGAEQQSDIWHNLIRAHEPGAEALRSALTELGENLKQVAQKQGTLFDAAQYTMPQTFTESLSQIAEIEQKAKLARMRLSGPARHVAALEKAGEVVPASLTKIADDAKREVADADRALAEARATHRKLVGETKPVKREAQPGLFGEVTEEQAAKDKKAVWKSVQTHLGGGLFGEGSLAVIYDSRAELIRLGNFYIRKGVRSFKAWAKLMARDIGAMLKDSGEAFKPKDLAELLRGLYHESMESASVGAIVRELDVRHGKERELAQGEMEKGRTRQNPWLRAGTHGMVSPMDVLNELGGKESELFRALYRDPAEGNRKTWDVWFKYDDQVLAEMKKLGVTDAMLKKATKALDKKIAPHEVVLPSTGKPHQLTSGNRMSLYLQFQDPYVRKELFGEFPSGSARATTRQQTDFTEADFEAIIKTMPAWEKKLAEAGRAILNGPLYDEVRRVHKFLTGKDLKKEGGGLHWHIARDGEAVAGDPVNERPLASVRRALMPEDLDVFKERKGGSAPILYGDFFNTFSTVLAQFSGYVGKAPSIHRARAILKNRAFRQAMRRNAKWAADRMDDIEKGLYAFEGHEMTLQAPIEAGVAGFTRKVTMALVGAKPQIATYQVGTLMNAVTAGLPMGDLLEGFAKMGKWAGRGWEAQAELSAASSIMRDRFESGGFGLLSPQGRTNMVRRTFGVKSPASERLAMWGVRRADTRTILAINYAAKAEAKRKGLKGAALVDAAARRTEEVTSETQPTWDPMTASALGRQAKERPVLKLALMFTTVRFKNLSIAYRAVSDWRHDEISTAEMTKRVAIATIGNVIFVNAVRAGYFAAIAALWRAKDEKEWTDHLRDLLANMLSGWPIVGDLIGLAFESGLSGATGEGRRMVMPRPGPIGGTVKAASEGIYDTARLLRKALKGEGGKAKVGGRIIESVLKTAGAGAGLPLPAVGQAVGPLLRGKAGTAEPLFGGDGGGGARRKSTPRRKSTTPRRETTPRRRNSTPRRPSRPRGFTGPM